MKDRFSNSPTLDMSDELLSFLSDLLRVSPFDNELSVTSLVALYRHRRRRLSGRETSWGRS